MCRIARVAITRARPRTGGPPVGRWPASGPVVARWRDTPRLLGWRVAVPRSRRRALVIPALCGLALALGPSSPADACSCAGPRPRLLTPNRADAAPLNAKIRLEVPLENRVQDPHHDPQMTGEIVIRPLDGPPIAVTSRRTPDGIVEVLELTPTRPLLPRTTYEVEIVRPTVRPAIYVIGTFTTGEATDTTAPQITKVDASPADPEDVPRTCRAQGPWLNVDLVADDPSRTDAALVYGVWRADAAGRIDGKRPPATIVAPDQDRDGKRVLHVGRTSICDPRAFALPAKGPVTLGIAAIDEAGNVGPIRRVVVRLPRSGQ